RLQRGKLVSAADWHRLRDLGNQLFNEPRPTAHRSLQSQDRFAATLSRHAGAKRTVLQGMHARIVHLGVEHGDRLKELASANTRLGALPQTTTHSHKAFTQLLAVSPDDTSDGIRSSVQQAQTIRDAPAQANEPARTTLAYG